MSRAICTDAIVGARETVARAKGALSQSLAQQRAAQLSLKLLVTMTLL